MTKITAASAASLAYLYRVAKDLQTTVTNEVNVRYGRYPAVILQELTANGTLHALCEWSQGLPVTSVVRRGVVLPTITIGSRLAHLRSLVEVVLRSGGKGVAMLRSSSPVVHRWLLRERSDPQPLVLLRPLGESTLRTALAYVRTTNLCEAQGPFKFSSTQVQIPEPLCREIRSFGLGIPNELLADDGREDDIHVTVRYGLHTDSWEDVAPIVARMSPPQLTLGKITKFVTEKADVLKIDVESDALHEMNALLRERLVGTDKFPTYVPHITIAYLRRGHAAKWEGSDAFFSRVVTPRFLAFCNREGKKHLFDLLNSPRKAVVAQSEEALRLHAASGPHGRIHD